MQLLHQFISKVYCTGDDLAARFTRAARRAGRAFGLGDLRYEINAVGQPVKVPSVDDWVLYQLEKHPDTIEPLTNGNEQRIVCISAFELAHIPWCPWYVLLESPPGAVIPEKFLQFFSDFCDDLDATYGGASPSAAEGIVYAQSQPEVQVPPPYGLPVEYGLPALTMITNLTSASVPEAVRWTNYWPIDTQRTVGYSRAQHEKLFARFTYGANESLTFQVTEEPLDFTIEEHRHRVLAVYDAFPAIGGRDERFRRV